MNPRVVILVLVFSTLAASGCRTCCRRPLFNRFRNPSPPRGYLEAPMDRIPADRIPPAAIPSDPDLPSPRTSNRTLPSETLYPTDRPPSTLGLPPSSSKSLLDDPSLFPTKPVEPPLAIPSTPNEVQPAAASEKVQPNTPPEKMPEPKPEKTLDKKIGLAGVSNFVNVSPGLANGRKPDVDGFDALRNAGVQSVVYLHSSDANITTVKELAEKKGLIFTAIPVDAATLRSGFSRFADVIGSRSARPVFVFDDDGVRTGALWYLYFRTIDSLSDDAAQVKAGPLGLRDGTGTEKSTFWLAIQEYLSKR